MTTVWVLYHTEIRRVGFPEPALARAVFTRSIEVPGWQPAAPKPGSMIFMKKTSLFFEIHRTSDNSMGSVAL